MANNRKQMTRKSKDPNVIDIKPLPFPVVQPSGPPTLGSGQAEKARKALKNRDKVINRVVGNKKND